MLSYVLGLSINPGKTRSAKHPFNYTVHLRVILARKRDKNGHVNLKKTFEKESLSLWLSTVFHPLIKQTFVWLFSVKARKGVGAKIATLYTLVASLALYVPKLETYE